VQNVFETTAFRVVANGLKKIAVLVTSNFAHDVHDHNRNEKWQHAQRTMVAVKIMQPPPTRNGISWNRPHGKSMDHVLHKL